MRAHRASAGGACLEDGKHREQGGTRRRPALWPAFSLNRPL